MPNSEFKNSYAVESEEILFRRAKKDDDFGQIASLIFGTDPYIYPFWFNQDIEHCQSFLSEKIAETGFIFNYNNIYVAFNKTTQKIVGIIVALDSSIDLNYDYELLKTINYNYDFTIKNYIKPIVDEAKSLSPEEMYIPNVCVEPEYTGKHIGKKMLGYFISQMEQQGFERFSLDCLLHNLRAKNLYHALGFREMREIVGFDGTDNSTVEVVSMLRKKGEYLPEEFSVNYKRKLKWKSILSSRKSLDF